MNKKELFECLSGLSKTNNLRDGIDIRKEEANIIVKEIERLNKELEKYKYSADELNEIERLNNIINKAIDYMDRRDLDWGSDEHNKMMNILKGSDKE